MFRIFKNKKAQNTAEYAILIALVIGGVVAMQTYAQRALQGRMRDASIFLRDQTQNAAAGGGIAELNGSGLGNTLQYEPYYTNTSTPTSKSTTSAEFSGGSNKTSNAVTAYGTNQWERTQYNGLDAADQNL